MATIHSVRRRDILRLACLFLVTSSSYLFFSNFEAIIKAALCEDEAAEYSSSAKFEQHIQAPLREEVPTPSPTPIVSSPAAHKALPLPQHSRLEAHHWGSDGLLTVNPRGAHPIFQLIARAEAAWSEKHNRASKTLEEAVAEYRRRYHRAPPLGFDSWWNYVQDNDVQLPDEYDRIYHDLEPYWGIDPLILQESQERLEREGDTFTIGKMQWQEPIAVVNVSMETLNFEDVARYMAGPQINLLRPVQDYLPPFRAVFWPHDNPRQVVDWKWREAALNAAASETYIDFVAEHLSRETGWEAACPPTSPLNQGRPDEGRYGTGRVHKTFIYDHRLAMDPCMHPEHLALHGQFLPWTRGPTPDRSFAPIFGNSGTSLHGDIHITPTFNGHATESVKFDRKWKHKSDDRLSWRGSPTGMQLTEDNRWVTSQRARLVAMANPAKDDKRKETVLPPRKSPRSIVGYGEEVPVVWLNPAMMDVAFTGELSGCDPDACYSLKKNYRFGSWLSNADAGDYKFILDVDGNGWSGRFRRLMSMNSLIFKSTIYPEWYTDRIQPWVHYIPVQLDYSDLYDALVFFGGDLSGKGAHDDLAKKIGGAGKMWTERYWRKEDMTAYMFRLFLEYARVMSLDRNEMNFELEELE